MWIVDHQMNLRVSEQFGSYYVRLPLTRSATIVRDNALRIDWEEVIGKDKLSYILGNPPFNGARTMTAAQKEDMALVFGNLKGLGDLDYVTAWYKKATDFTLGTRIRCAFVSTNSVAQGEQPTILWKPLMERGVCINFAVPTFKWSSEVKGKAAVQVAIIGFSYIRTEPNINQYLLEAPTVFIERRKLPLCDSPEIGIGNQPIDGGNYLFTEFEKDAFIAKEPGSAKWFRPWMGSDEFINGYTRFCLFLKNCPLDELRKMPEAVKRVENVRNFRLASESERTREIADTPLRFQVENIPKLNYIVIPEVSSEQRRYIPIGFLSPDILVSNLVKVIPNATLYHFGVLTSNAHMAWVRAVCGRFGMAYRYSKDIVYNNFPWPDASDEGKAEIEKTALGILKARLLYPDSSLADLYDPRAMPGELLKAHRDNDRAVMRLYGVSVNDMTESARVAMLMERYQEITEARKII
jgi:hypothetical protein